MGDQRTIEQSSASFDEPPERSRFRLRRWAAIGIIVFLGILVLFLFGGSWYFSSQIASDALEVDLDDAPDLEIEVASVGDGEIAFVIGDDPDDDLVSDEIIGVAWASGYGQAGAVTEQTDTRVVRSFTHLTGEPIAAGDLVGLEGYSYPADPMTALGIAVEEVTYTSPFGEFDAWYVPGTDDTWVIFVHGRGAHLREALRVLPTVIHAGHPVLMITYRNDPDQPATEDRLARFGATEWEDLEGAVQYALDNGAEDVIVYGFSMGGAIAVSFMVESDQAGEVTALVLDAPALELGAMVDARAADTNLPLLPVRVPPPMTTLAKWLAGTRYDIDWSEIDYLERVDELSIPILLFHGTEDDSVPVSTSDDLAASRPDLVTYVRVDGASHVRSWNVDSDRYEQAVAGFLAQVG